jgi:hypothetical protein
VILACFIWVIALSDLIKYGSFKKTYLKVSNYLNDFEKIKIFLKSDINDWKVSY